MGYLNALQSAAAPMGSPPPTGAPNVGTPPPIPSTEPPPYDVLQDPAWAGHVHPSEHAFRAFLNELSPEHRQMLLQKLARAKAPAPMPAPGPMMAATPMPPGL